MLENAERRSAEERMNKTLDGIECKEGRKKDKAEE